MKRMEEARGLIKKNGARRRGKKQHGQPVGVNRGLKGRVGRGVIFAQPIPATLSTVKTWALTTGDHNRAYLSAPSPPPLRPSISFSLVAVAPKAISHFYSSIVLAPPSRYRGFYRRNFESTRRDREKEEEETRGKERVAGVVSLHGISNDLRKKTKIVGYDFKVKY